jgi:hypothetical protein
LQKQYPDLPQQAPPHEIAAAEAAEAKQDATADAAHAPEPAPNPKQELAPTAFYMGRNKTISS